MHEKLGGQERGHVVSCATSSYRVTSASRNVLGADRVEVRVRRAEHRCAVGVRQLQHTGRPPSCSPDRPALRAQVAWRR